MKDEEVIQMVNLCAEQNGCKISKIDFENHIIEIDGPTKEAQVKCAIAIEDIFGRYAV